MRLLVSGGVIAPGTAVLPGPPAAAPTPAASAAKPAEGGAAAAARPAAPELLPGPVPPAGATLANE